MKLYSNVYEVKTICSVQKKRLLSLYHFVSYFPFVIFVLLPHYPNAYNYAKTR